MQLQSCWVCRAPIQTDITRQAKNAKSDLPTGAPTVSLCLLAMCVNESLSTIVRQRLPSVLVIRRDGLQIDQQNLPDAQNLQTHDRGLMAFFLLFSRRQTNCCKRPWQFFWSRSNAGCDLKTAACANLFCALAPCSHKCRSKRFEASKLLSSNRAIFALFFFAWLTPDKLLQAPPAIFLRQGRMRAETPQLLPVQACCVFSHPGHINTSEHDLKPPNCCSPIVPCSRRPAPTILPCEFERYGLGPPQPLRPHPCCVSQHPS